MRLNKPLAGGAALAALAAPTSAALAGASHEPDHDLAVRARFGAGIVGVGLRRAARHDAADAVVRLERDLARLRGTAAPHHLRRHVAHLSTQQLLRRERTLRRRIRSLRSSSSTASASTTGGPASVSPALQAIAACESGGNPRAIGGGGAYRGKYQFTYATWAAVGGSGDPAAAPVAEQDRRAAMLYAEAGASQWPVCGG